jgi:hypothetical protein
MDIAGKQMAERVGLFPNSLIQKHFSQHTDNIARFDARNDTFNDTFLQWIALSA